MSLISSLARTRIWCFLYENWYWSVYKTTFFLRPNMSGVFITLSQTPCLDYRWTHSSDRPQSTWSGSQQTFLCICSHRIGTCNFRTIAVPPATFLTSNLSTGVEALFTIYTCNSTECFCYPAHFTPCFGTFYRTHVRLSICSFHSEHICLSFRLLPQAVGFSWSDQGLFYCSDA